MLPVIAGVDSEWGDAAYSECSNWRWESRRTGHCRRRRSDHADARYNTAALYWCCHRTDGWLLGFFWMCKRLTNYRNQMCHTLFCDTVSCICTFWWHRALFSNFADTAVAKFKFWYRKYREHLFDYIKSSNFVKKISFELGLPSFDTLLHNFNVSFLWLWLLVKCLLKYCTVELFCGCFVQLQLCDFISALSSWWMNECICSVYGAGHCEARNRSIAWTAAWISTQSALTWSSQYPAVPGGSRGGRSNCRKDGCICCLWI